MSHRNAESGGGIGDVMHLPSLPDAGAARDMLDRLVAEFGPIAQRRGYRVSSLTEMCCCGDGVDHLRGRGSGGRGRRARIMPPNVGGYNLGGGGRCSIHLRLRSPAADGGRHDLLPYDEVASTMAHELAHCRHGPHSAEFYELMAEIQRQRRVFLDRGVVVDGDNFPMGEVGARALGGGGVGGGARTAGDRRGASALAAERRHARGTLLGGGGAAGSRNTNRGVGVGGGGRGPPEPTLLPPREAARIAAERRLADAQWCLPCSEIIEILEDDSSESDAEEGGGKANDGLSYRKSGRGDAESAYRDDAIGSKRPLQDLSSSSSAAAAKTRVQKRQASSDATSSTLAKKASEGRPAQRSRNRIGTESTADCAVGANASGVIGDDAKCGAIGDCGGGATKGILTIDLTDDRDDGEDEIGKNAATTTTSTDLAVATTSAALQNAASSPTTSSASDDGRYWSCGSCTLRNYRPLALSCEACGTTRGEGDDDDDAAIADLVRRDDERDRIVDEERRRSRADFGGFDIYGSARRTTSTMRHLT